MFNQVLLLAVIFAIGIVAFIALVWIIATAIVEKRRKKHAWKRGELEERAEWIKHVVEQGSEPEIKEGITRAATVYMSKETEERIQQVQVRTKTESPGEVLSDALRFYSEIVNIYNPGNQLLFRKSADDMGLTLIRFKPLDRIEKKVEIAKA